MNDGRWALRQLRKTPALTLIAVVTLALGIGANGAVFSMVHALLLKPVTFERLDRLTWVTGMAPRLGIEQEGVSPGDFLEWKARCRSFEALGAMGAWDASLTGDAAPERVRVEGLTPGLLEMVSTRPSLGRTFVPDEGEPGRDGVVLLSHGLWTRRFGADPRVVGRAIRVDGESKLVIGVMSPDFDFPKGTDLWAPLAFTADQVAARGVRTTTVIGLLARGVTPKRAQSELATVAADIARRFPATHTDHGVRVRGLRDAMAGDVAPVFYALLTLAAALVLVIACANVANLLLARASARRREIAVRIAMGASRVRLLRQLLVESVLLALIGALGGLGVAVWGVELMVKAMPASVSRFIPGWTSFQVDWVVVSFAIVVAVVCGILFGLAPALETLKVDVQESLKEGQREGQGRSGQRARRALVIAQVAGALVLASGASLVVQGFHRLVAIGPGFDPRGVLTLHVALPTERYTEPAQVAEYARHAVERLSAMPHVTAATAATRLPWTDWGGRGNAYPLEVAGRSQRPSERARASMRFVTGGYFATLRIPMLSGRAFDAGDAESAEPVAVVSRSLARRLAPQGSPIGMRVKLDHPRLASPYRRVVGVCGDVTHTWWEPDPAPLYYAPFAQQPFATMTLALRTDREPMALASAARIALASVDPEQPVWDVATLQRQMDDLYAPLRMSAAMMTVFGALALVLAMVGVYGLISYSVSRRTHEIGVRLALGASRRAVLALVIGQGLTLAALGLAVGIPVAWAMGALAASKLFGVVAFDVGLLTAIAAALLLVSLLASYLPARHAARVDPMIALRNE